MKALLLALTLCASLASDLFTNGPIRTIRIEIAPEGIEALRTAPRAYVPARVAENEQVYTNVAVHLKGGSSFEAIDKRPSITIHFSKLEQGRRFHELRKIHLNNSNHDHSLLSEQICGELFRSAGVPAPRTTQARVLMNGRELGIYVLKEGFEREFLGQHFSNPYGKVYEREDGAELHIKYRLEFFVSGEGYSSDFRKIKHLSAADLDGVWKRLKSAFDIENVISLLAMEFVAGMSDGYGDSENNFKLYKDPATGKLIFLAHGRDMSFRSVARAGAGGNAARILMAHPEGRAFYEKRIREIFANQFQLGPLTNRVIELARPVRAEIERVEGRDAANVYDGHVDQLVQRIANRWHEVDRELNGK
jgi:spore coat protein H